MFEEPNFLEKQSGNLKFDHQASTGQWATMLGRISFREVSQQRIEKYLGRKLLPPY